MAIDIRRHPDAPDLDALNDIIVEPVPRGEIDEHRARGDTLIEDKLREREDLDIRLELNDDPGGPVEGNIGTVLYRYTQLFGVPQFPEYHAGEDISNRSDETFKYLLRVQLDSSDELPDEWLVTVYDWRVELGASVAAWRYAPDEDDHEKFTADTATALTTLQLVHNIGNEPVECEYKNIWF